MLPHDVFQSIVELARDERWIGWQRLCDRGGCERAERACANKGVTGEAIHRWLLRVRAPRVPPALGHSVPRAHWERSEIDAEAIAVHGGGDAPARWANESFSSHPPPNALYRATRFVRNCVSLCAAASSAENSAPGAG